MSGSFPDEVDEALACGMPQPRAIRELLKCRTDKTTVADVALLATGVAPAWASPLPGDAHGCRVAGKNETFQDGNFFQAQAREAPSENG